VFGAASYLFTELHPDQIFVTSPSLNSEGDARTSQCPAVSIASELLLRYRTSHEGRCADGIQTQTQVCVARFFSVAVHVNKVWLLEQTYNLPSII
jgi:hypothetical protein